MKRFGIAEVGVLGVLLVLGPVAFLTHSTHTTPIVGTTMMGSAFRAKTSAQRSLNQVHLRMIHQSFVTYAAVNKQGGQDGWFPGCDPTGQVTESSPASRFQILLEGNYITPDDVINPADRDSQPWNGQGDLTAENFSYAMLEIDNTGERHAEWSETFNPLAVVVSDRNTGIDTDENVSSVWSPTAGSWAGSVIYNDNSVSLHTSHIHTHLRYGQAEMIDEDNLFAKDTTDDSDALLIHELVEPLAMQD